MGAKARAEARIGSLYADRYELLRLLGRGGVGAVYEAQHCFTKRKVALKVIEGRIAKSDTARQRFLREAQAPAQIGHPGICEILDAGIGNDDTLYLALELLQGKDLYRATREAALPTDTVVQIAVEVLDALHAAHAVGIVHRDIKPENVFLVFTERGPQAKLLDFGITHLVDEEGARLTGTGMIVGTPHFMSPEQAKGERVDARSDIWSVGALLFDAVARRPPFEADRSDQVLVKILTEPPPPLEEVAPNAPRALAAVVEQAMQRDPSRRFQSARAMAEALRQSVGSEGVNSEGNARTIPFVRPDNAASHVSPLAPSGAHGVPTSEYPSGPSASSSQNVSASDSSVSTRVTQAAKTTPPANRRALLWATVVLVALLVPATVGALALLTTQDNASAESTSELETTPPQSATGVPAPSGASVEPEATPLGEAEARPEEPAPGPVLEPTEPAVATSDPSASGDEDPEATPTRPDDSRPASAPSDPSPGPHGSSARRVADRPIPELGSDLGSLPQNVVERVPWAAHHERQYRRLAAERIARGQSSAEDERRAAYSRCQGHCGRASHECVRASPANATACNVEFGSCRRQCTAQFGPR
ncbi:MAG: protein kinase [Myxococcota bacterium]